jgi:predicted nucleotidyltransferase
MGPLILESHRAELETICRRRGVERLDLFGSAAGERFDPESSDLDFLVSFVSQTPARLFDRYFGLKEELEHLFGRRVDLVMEGAIGPVLLRER